MIQEINTIRVLANNHNLRRVKAGETIFRAGERGSSLFGIVSGEVVLDWGAQMQETIGAGSSFGVGALVDPDHVRFGTAIAHTDCELLEMDRGQFLFAVQELPMFGLELLNSLEQRLSHLKQQLL